MEFEVLTHHDAKRTWFDDVVRFILNPRRQLQDWDSNPPIFVALGIFALVTAELTLIKHLFNKQGIHFADFNSLIQTAIPLFISILIFGYISKTFAGFFNRKGHFRTAVFLMMVCLLPFLLSLPVSVVIYLSGQDHSAITLINILLALQVLVYWRETIEVTFELSKWQSLAVTYLCFIFLVGTTLLFGYISLIKSLASLA